MKIMGSPEMIRSGCFYTYRKRAKVKHQKGSIFWNQKKNTPFLAKHQTLRFLQNSWQNEMHPLFAKIPNPQTCVTLCHSIILRVFADSHQTRTFKAPHAKAPKGANILTQSSQSQTKCKLIPTKNVDLLQRVFLWIGYKNRNRR